MHYVEVKYQPEQSKSYIGSPRQPEHRPPAGRRIGRQP